MSAEIERLRGKLERAELASEVVLAPDGNVSVVAHSNRTAADRALTVVSPALEQLRAERDALKAAIAEVRRLCDLTIAASCRRDAIDQAVDTLAVLDRTLDTPTAPEGPEDDPGPLEPVENFVGIFPHPFVQSRAVDNVRVCVCGKWPDHHIHGADPCGCDECRAAPESPESEETTDGR